MGGNPPAAAATAPRVRTRNVVAVCGEAQGERSLSVTPAVGRHPVPATTSGSDHDPALARAGASRPAPAQRLGERPVVPGQVRHLPVELRDLPPQGLDLRGLLLLRLLVLRGQRPQGGVAVA